VVWDAQLSLSKVSTEGGGLDITVKSDRESAFISYFSRFDISQSRYITSSPTWNDLAMESSDPIGENASCRLLVNCVFPRNIGEWGLDTERWQSSVGLLIRPKQKGRMFRILRSKDS